MTIESDAEYAARIKAEHGVDVAYTDEETVYIFPEYYDLAAIETAGLILILALLGCLLMLSWARTRDIERSTDMWVSIYEKRVHNARP